MAGWDGYQCLNCGRPLVECFRDGCLGSSPGPAKSGLWFDYATGKWEAPQASVSDLGEGTSNLSSSSRESTPEADPVAQTLGLLPKSTHGPNLIKFLAQKTERTAKIKDITKHIYKSINKSTLAKARRLVRRNVQYLEDRNAPLRIVWDKKTSQAGLIGR